MIAAAAAALVAAAPYTVLPSTHRIASVGRTLREHVDHRRLPPGTRIFYDARWIVTLANGKRIVFPRDAEVQKTPMGTVVDDGRARFVFHSDAVARYVDYGTQYVFPGDEPVLHFRGEPDVAVIGNAR